MANLKLTDVGKAYGGNVEVKGLEIGAVILCRSLVYQMSRMKHIPRLSLKTFPQATTSFSTLYLDFKVPRNSSVL